MHIAAHNVEFSLDEVGSIACLFQPSSPLLRRVGDVHREHFGKVLSVGVLRISRDETAGEITLVVRRFAPEVFNVVLTRDELIFVRDCDSLVEDVGELVVDGLQIIVVNSIGAAAHIALQVINARKKNLLAAFGSTEDDSTIVLIFPFANEEEHLWEVRAGEFNAGNLIVKVAASVFHQVCQND